MDLVWLHDFVTLADTRSFSRAAERRHVTQPAFSRRVRALEEWVGTALFERTAQGARLTPAGERFGRGAPALIRGVADLRRVARDEADGQGAGVLRIAATRTLAFTVLPARLRAARAREARASEAIAPLRLIADALAACEELMLAEQVQFVLCHDHPLAPNRLATAEYVSTQVGDDTLVPLVATDAAGKPRWRLRDDPAHRPPVLAYRADSGLGRILAAHGRVADDQPTEGRDAAMLLALAVAGHGIAWLPASLAVDDVAAGRLVPAGTAADAVPLAIRLFRPAASQGIVADRFWATLIDEGTTG